MKVCVDRNLCMNAGMCSGVAPDIFEMDDNGELILLLEEVPEDRLEDVKDAVSCCPMSALSLVED